MKISAVKVTEVTVGKNEAGMFEFKDTGRTIEIGDKAFVIKTEDPMTGSTNNVYFKDKTKAEEFEE